MLTRRVDNPGTSAAARGSQADDAIRPAHQVAGAATVPVLEFDIVVPTRNRQAVLPISLPLMFSQSRLPRRFILVDASDNFGAVRKLVEGLFEQANTRIDLQILRADAGSSHQRNVGLRQVQSPVVLFPDDDSLWFPGTTEAIMRVYERDTEGVIGAVAPRVSALHPPGVFGGEQAPYRLELRDRMAIAIRRLFRLLPFEFFPDPIYHENLWSQVGGGKTAPDWLGEEDVQLCGPIIGYRMSFRTDLILSLGGFDESLGRYSMFEDSDASMGVLKDHLLVCANRAVVFHYRVPGQRVSGAEFGMMAMLNRAYVVCKHAPPGSPARRWLRNYLYYKMLRYVLQTYSQYGRSRLRGAYHGLLPSRQLLNVPMEEISDRFVKLRNELVEQHFREKPPTGSRAQHSA